MNAKVTDSPDFRLEEQHDNVIWATAVAPLLLRSARLFNKVLPSALLNGTFIGRAHSQRTMTPMPDKFEIRVVAFEPVPGHWVAQCLEYDIGCEAKSIEDLMRRFHIAFVSEIALSLEHGSAPLQNVPKAPEKFWAMFHTGWAELRPRMDPIPLLEPSKVSPRVQPTFSLTHAAA
jgi:hypothetical protein